MNEIAYLVFAVCALFLILMIVFATLTLKRRGTDAEETEVRTDETITRRKRIDSVTTTDVAHQLFSLIQTDFASVDHFGIDRNRVTTETIYLQLFVIDFSTYLVLRDPYQRQVVLDIFWDFVDGAGLTGAALTKRLDDYSKVAKQSSPSTLYSTLGDKYASFLRIGSEGAKEWGSSVAYNTNLRVEEYLNGIRIE